MTFALISTNFHLLRHPRVLQVSQTSCLLRERLLRECHARPIQVTVDDHHHQHLESQSHLIPPLHSPNKINHIQNVTVVDSSETACTAMKALIEASDQGKPVAWTVRQHTKGEHEKSMSLSAFAGHDVNFGNGPHLFIKARDNNNESAPTERYMDQLKRYFELGGANNMFVWFNLPKSMNTLAGLGIQPKGFHRDVQSMVPMVPSISAQNTPSKTRPPITDIHTAAELIATLPHSDIDFQQDPSVMSAFDDNDEEIRNACYEATMLHAVHEALCAKLEETKLCEKTTPHEYVDDMRTALDAYDNFFRLVHGALHDVEKSGVHINTDALRNVESKILAEKEELEKTFLEWASRSCSDAKYINPQKAAHLRHLLFAPCRNAVDETQSLGTTAKMKVSVKPELLEEECKEKEGGKKKRGRKRTRAVKKEIELKGIGMMPHVWLKSGWPSTSKAALTQLVQRASHDHGGRENEAAFVEAMDGLIRAGELKTKANKICKASTSLSNALDGVHDRLHYRHYCGVDEIGVLRSQTDKKIVVSKEGNEEEEMVKFGNEVRHSVAAAEGNQLVILEYKRLRLWALAQLSGCDALRERVESETDLATSGALRMYEGVGDMVANGELSVTDVNVGSDLKVKLPITYDVVRKVDAAFRHGGGVGGTAQIRAVTGVRGKKAEELRRRWYGGHPGVEEWHEEWRDKALREGMVGTMMGRMTHMVIDNGYANGKGNSERQLRVKAEKALTKGMDWVLGGTAAEAVMAGVTRIMMNEKLRGLGWSVVLADGEVVVLEGPEYSVDSAVPLIEDDAKKPFPMLDSCLNVNYTVTADMPAVL